MINHISIQAKNPLRVAKALAEIWNTKAFRFFPAPESYMVMAFDEYGTNIEVYPLEIEVTPDDGRPPRFVHHVAAPKFTAFHAAISVPVEQERIEQIAKREGWRVQLCDSKASLQENCFRFKVIELWVENRVMLELLTPSLVSQYLELTSSPP